MLLLKKKFFALVRAGVKTQTIRFWRRPMLHVGQIALIPGLGRVRVDAVDPLPALKHLTAADARADGFPSRRALLAELARIYGPALPADKKLFRVRFTWPAPEMSQRPAATKTIATKHRRKKTVAIEDRRTTLAAFLRAATFPVRPARAIRSAKRGASPRR